MEKRLSVFAPIVVLILISVIGFGLAYNSTVSVESDVIGSYCSIVGDVNGSPVNSVSIIVDNSGDSPIYNLGFTSTSGETQETLSLQKSSFCHFTKQSKTYFRIYLLIVA